MATNRIPEVFISYAHEDTSWKDTLIAHMTLLQRQGLLSSWHDKEIPPGSEFSAVIDEHMEAAHVIIMVVSTHFLASQYCYEIEMKRALERHEAGEATVVPLIVRPCDWQETPLSKLQVLPTNGVAITKWQDEDEAFLDAVTHLRGLLKQYQTVLQSKSESAGGSFTESGIVSFEKGESDERLSIGVDVGATKIAAGLVRLRRGEKPEMHADKVQRIDHDEKKNAEAVLEKLVTIIEDVVQAEGVSKAEIDAIGLGLPGMVRRPDGLLSLAAGLQIHNYNFCSQLQQMFGVPVHADNDVNCSTLAELAYGYGGVYSDFVCIYIGTGIGSGVVVNKRMVRGHNWAAGEVGHLKIDIRPEARECTCGQKGCFEEYASARALIRMARVRVFDIIDRQRESALGELDPKAIDTREIVKFIKQGDSEARELAEDMASYLSVGCANVAMLLNPEAIVLGGGIMDGMYEWPEFEKALNRGFAAHAVPACAQTGLVRPSFKRLPHVSPAPIIGAAVLPFETGFAY